MAVTAGLSLAHRTPVTELITRSGAWLLMQASATLPDTLVMKTVAAQRGWFETMVGVANAILALTILGLAIVVGPAAWKFWRSFQRMRTLVDRMYADVTPLLRHASNIADNVDYISTALRNDVQQVSATIASANRRLSQAVAHTATRMNEFNALMQVMQQEAEQAFVATASAVRGVRTGAAAFGGLDEEADAASGGNGNGDDDESDEDTPDEQWLGRHTAARPRLRSRRNRRD
jgi:uncharacterized protein YoxC